MSPAAPRDDLLRGLWRENPVFVQTLGMCPTLAVTNTVANCVAMGLATLAVLVLSCVLVAWWKKRIPAEVRITAYVLIIATFVTVADMVIEGVSPGVHAALGPFIALIVVNCIILARQEAFAARNPVGRAFLDALGTGLGFTLALFAMGVVREALGSATLLGVRVLPDAFQPWTVMSMPPGGFLTLAFLLLLRTAWSRRRAARRAAAGLAAASPTPAAPPAPACAHGAPTPVGRPS
jgi:electron transport complex protein RnfE